MIFTLLLLAQLVLAIAAVLRERRDPRFDGERMGYRS